MSDTRESRINEEVNRLLRRRDVSVRDVLIAGAILQHVTSPAQKWCGSYVASAPAIDEGAVIRFLGVVRTESDEPLPDTFDIVKDNLVLYVLHPVGVAQHDTECTNDEYTGVVVFDPYAPEDPGTVVYCGRVRDSAVLRHENKWDIEIDLQCIFGEKWRDLQLPVK